VVVPCTATSVEVTYCFHFMVVVIWERKCSGYIDRHSDGLTEKGGQGSVRSVQWQRCTGNAPNDHFQGVNLDQQHDMT